MLFRSDRGEVTLAEAMSSSFHWYPLPLVVVGGDLEYMRHEHIRLLRGRGLIVQRVFLHHDLPQNTMHIGYQVRPRSVS